jgi:hypothetical protein
MGFKSLLENQVQGLMKTLGQDDGLAPYQTYSQVTDSGYDAVSMTNGATEVAHPDVPMVMARFKIDEVDGSKVVATDLKTIIAALDLPVTPAEEDIIVIQTEDSVAGPVGTRFQVKGIMGVPGNSVHILQIRKTS